MRQVIPFKKDIVFNTKLEEITSISLEHNLKLDNDNFISGEFVVSGDYKISSTSNRLELFSYNLPFDIVLDNSYLVEESTIDIEDFYYEIINDDTLRVNIEITIEGENKPEESVEEVLLETMQKDIISLNIDEPIEDVYSFSKENEDREDITIIKEENVIEEVEENISSENVKSLFSAINSDEEETFTTYHVHIVKENEDIEMILKKYGVTKEEFLNYNSMDEIVLGNKLIIPATIKND